MHTKIKKEKRKGGVERDISLFIFLTFLVLLIHFDGQACTNLIETTLVH